MVPNILRISWTAVVHKSNGYIRQHHTHSYAPSCDPSRTVTQSAWFLNELLSRRRSLTCSNHSDQIGSVKIVIIVIKTKKNKLIYGNNTMPTYEDSYDITQKKRL